LKDYIDSFHDYDARLAREEEEYIKRAPICCCCQKPILDNEALYVDGEWFCKGTECMVEFHSDMESKYRGEIA
jgi:hypothetical protein